MRVPRLLRPVFIGTATLLLGFSVIVTSALADTAPFDLNQTVNAVVKVTAEVPADARTAAFLGTEREGNGIVIDDDGLVLTIGYLILEAMSANVANAAGEMVPAEIVAYDYDTGFGLLRALDPLDIAPLRLGSASELNERDPVLVVGSGGQEATIGAFVVSRREFAGYWEYLLDSAIFTSPPHPNWGGAALIGPNGRLLGVGSLLVRDAMPPPDLIPGNMFVPIDLLKPILGELLELGRAGGKPRPWLGMFSAESLGRVVVTSVARDGPADSAGIESGDVVVSVSGETIDDMGRLYRKIWSLGEAGVDVPITVLRGSQALDIVVRSGDRYDYLKLRQTY